MPVIRPSRRSHPHPCGWKDHIRREAVVGRFVKVARKSKLPENDGTYVEGEYSRDAAAQAAGELAGKTKALLPELCIWTVEGC